MKITLLVFLSLFGFWASLAQIKPNIVYILVDDLGYGDLNLEIEGFDVFKNPHITPPHLAKFAKEGMVFTHHYSASPVYSPSRAGFLTGRTPTSSNINLRINDRHFEKGEFLRSEEITLAEKCLEAGYETPIFGKSTVSAMVGFFSFLNRLNSSAGLSEVPVIF